MPPGVMGLVAVKNLTEEGFDVTGFDRNDYVGGLWHYTDEDKTSVLPSQYPKFASVRLLSLTFNSHCHQYLHREGT